MLNSRELTLVLRARDEASRVLRGFRGSISSLDRETAAAAQRSMARGQAMATAGIGMAALGVGGVAMFNDMANAAMAYNEESAKTLTQVDGLNLSLGDIKKMGRDLAKSMPVDFKEVQGALYDIFSSIDVSAPEAQVLLRGIGTAAVAGSVDMQTAGQGIIEILNAYHMPATKVNRVNDVMFQLVRKGVGTYAQFSKTIGRSVPSAIKAGQSVEELAGGMAFLTRNGLSTAMASTALGRAFDALVKPKAQKNLKELGVDVVDAQGKFRPFSKIMGELRQKLEKLTPAARAAKLDEIFKGSGGTVQAMRAFNHAINDGSGQLQSLTKQMYNSKDAAAEAYKIMSNTPQAKLKAMNNQWEVMKTVIGDQVLPVKMKLVEWITKLMSVFSKLNPTVQKFIIYGAMIASVLLIVVGVVVTAIGIFTMLSAAAVLAGTTLGAAIGGALLVMGEVLIALALVAAAAYLIYKNWDKIKAGAIAAWKATVQEMQPAIAKVMEIKDEIVDLAKWVWNTLKPYFEQAWKSIWKGIQDAWNQIKPSLDQFKEAMTNLGSHIGNIITNILTWINGPLKVGIELFKTTWLLILPIVGAAITTLGQVIGTVFSAIGGILAGVITAVSGFINLVVALLTGDWAGAWKAAQQIVSGMGQAVISLLTGMGTIVKQIVVGLVKAVIGFFKNLWDTLVGHSIIPDMVNAIIKWIALLPVRIAVLILKMYIATVTKMAQMAAQGLVLAGRFVSWVGSKIGGLPGKVISYIGRMMTSVGQKMGQMATNAKSKASQLVSGVVGFLSGLPGKAVNAVSSLGGKMLAQGKAWINGAVNGVRAAGGTLISWFSSLPGKIKGAIPNPLGMLSGIGGFIVEGLASGIRAGLGKITSAISGLTSHIPGFIKRKLGISSPSKVMKDLARWIPIGFAQGINGSSSQVTAAMSALLSNVTNAYKKHQLSKTAYNNAKAEIASEKARLLLAARNRAATAAARAKYYRAVAAERKKQAAAAKKHTDTIQKINLTLNTTYLKGLKGTASQVASVSTSMKKTLLSGYQTGALTAYTYKKTVAQVSKAQSTMTKIATQRVQIADKITAANKKLADAVKLRDDFQKQVMDSMNSMRSILNAAPEAGSKDPLTAQGVIDKMKANLAKIKTFQSQMSQLLKLGLNKDTYQELVSAGPEQAGAMADALLKGGQGAISQVNSISSQLKSSATSLAKSAADSMYGAGVKAAQGLVKGLQSQQAALNKTMENAASSLVKAIKKALGIHSPSRVMMELGGNVGQGWVNGMASKMRDIERAGQAMATATIQNAEQPHVASHLVRSPFDRPVVSLPRNPGSLTATTQPDGSGGTTITIEHFEVHVDELAEIADVKWFAEHLPMLLQMRKGTP